MVLKNIFTAEWLIAAITLTVLTVLWRVIRKHTRCYFVAFNEFTTVRLQRMIKVRDYVMWAVVVAFGIGVIASVAAARVDKFLFG